MRPIHLLTITHRSTEQAMHRHAERFALDVPQCQLNPCYRLGSDATWRLPRHAIHVPVARLNRARILSQEYRLEILYRANDAVRVAPVRHLAVPGQARICPDRAELPRTPTCINYERLNIRYPHRICSTDRIVTVAVCRPHPEVHGNTMRVSLHQPWPTTQSTRESLSY